MRVICESVSKFLGQPVATTTPIVSAGLDSIGATELTHFLSERFGIQLPATLLFDHPTVEALTTVIQGFDTAI